ncbi:MAG: hypothetical protein IT423_05950, partial [Pirellulaceae bacterium]|nr:hypothetical protein [Pirellulaceae bacterium]
AYIKPMGNRQGPHVLATDWVGTHLARWFGLSTFDIAILTLTTDDAFPLPRNHRAQQGPAFATRALKGEPWGQSGLQLDVLVNPDDITRLVVFDTWTLNCDRHFHDATARRPNPDNVFLSSEGVEAGKRRLIAMDHGLCFIRSGEDLGPKLANLDKVRSEHVYGLFPEFRARLRQHIIEDCTLRLRQLDRETVEAIVASVPKEWDVSAESRRAWCELIYRRATFVADNFGSWIEQLIPWFGSQGNSENA